MKRICTSYVERFHGTVRQHVNRLSRLTLGFSRKWENHKAAQAINIAVYNLVSIHRTLRCTPAMKAGVTNRLWSISDLVTAKV